MVGGSGGQRSRESECWTVGRSDGAGTLGRSQGREVGEKVNLGHGQLDDWRGDTRKWEADEQKRGRKNGVEVLR